MTLRDALRSPSTADILYALPENFRMLKNRTQTEQQELDEAFEAYTGRKRPAPVHLEDDEKPVDLVSTSNVESNQSTIMSPETKEHFVTYTLKGYSKNGKTALYAGGRVGLRIPKTAFVDNVAPASFDVTGPFIGPREKKPKLTADERKALRAAKPKLTIAEKAAKLREKAAKLEAKAAEEVAQPAF